jgi:hypothetical protein
MSLFKKKTKEEKVLEEIKKKKEQMDKLKEEINKMGKLVLKDGKLTKIEDAQKEAPKTQVQEAPIDYTNPNMDDVMSQMRKQAQVPPAQPKQVPPPLSPEEYQRINRVRQQQEMAAFEQQYMEEQQMLAEQQRQAEIARQRQLQMEEYQMQQARQQPQQYQQPHQQMPRVVVTIEMITGSTLTLEVTGDKIESFVEALNLAIDNQSSFPMNNKVINGRNIVSYTLE